MMNFVTIMNYEKRIPSMEQWNHRNDSCIWIIRYIQSESDSLSQKQDKRIRIFTFFTFIIMKKFTQEELNYAILQERQQSYKDWYMAGYKDGASDTAKTYESSFTLAK